MLKFFTIYLEIKSTELSKSKKSYYTTYFENHCNNIKNTWEGIRSLININNPVNPRIAQININGIIIDKPKQVANEVNNFFVNVGPNTENDVPNLSLLMVLKTNHEIWSSPRFCVGSTAISNLHQRFK